MTILQRIIGKRTFRERTNLNKDDNYGQDNFENKSLKNDNSDKPKTNANKT